jgi:hypothetical protein
VQHGPAVQQHLQLRRPHHLTALQPLHWACTNQPTTACSAGSQGLLRGTVGSQAPGEHEPGRCCTTPGCSSTREPCHQAGAEQNPSASCRGHQREAAATSCAAPFTPAPPPAVRRGTPSARPVPPSAPPGAAATQPPHCRCCCCCRLLPPPMTQGLPLLLPHW